MDQRVRIFVQELEIELDALAPSWSSSTPDSILATIRAEVGSLERAVARGQPVVGDAAHVAALVLLLVEVVEPDLAA
jgi:hypothetical protein